MEMMDAVLGDRKKLEERPIFSCTYDDIEPLQKDGNYIDGALALSDYGVSIVPFQVVVSGAPCRPVHQEVLSPGAPSAQVLCEGEL
jgi:hypothetical protein